MNGILRSLKLRVRLHGIIFIWALLPIAGCKSDISKNDNNTADDSDSATDSDTLLPRCVAIPEMRITGTTVGYDATYIWGQIPDAPEEVAVVLGEGANQLPVTSGEALNMPLTFLNKYSPDGSLAWVHLFQGDFTFELFPSPQGFYIQGIVPNGATAILDQTAPDATVIGTADIAAFLAGFNADGTFGWVKPFSGLSQLVVTATGSIIATSYTPGSAHAWDGPSNIVWHQYSPAGELESEHSQSEPTETIPKIQRLADGTLESYGIPDESLLFIKAKRYSKYSAGGEWVNSIGIELFDEASFNSPDYVGELWGTASVSFDNIITASSGEELVVVTQEKEVTDTGEEWHSYFMSSFSSNLEPIILSRLIFKYNGTEGSIKLIRWADDAYHVVFVPGYTDTDMSVSFGDATDAEPLTIPAESLPMIAAVYDSTGTYQWHKQLVDDSSVRAPATDLVSYIVPARYNASFCGFALAIPPSDEDFTEQIDTDSVSMLGEREWLTTQFVVYDNQYNLMGVSNASIATTWKLETDGSIVANLVERNGIVTINDSPFVSNGLKIVKFAADGTLPYALDSGKPSDLNELSPTPYIVVATEDTASSSVGKPDAPLVLSSAPDLSSAHLVLFNDTGDVTLSSKVAGIRFVSDMSHCRP
ncbi:MAG: hypothetical protein JXX29_21180 [Deltaproteobacteria bacterium]|nr:hypothetical protein [Deltaproteobacteria bacterium]MBN2674209.1 hypothetical protein [Deltaproteobacteria bacterium]